MPNKINTSDYNFTRLDAEAFFSFTIWINAHPQGGIFIYKDYRIEVKPVV